jgi:transposase-like protein
MMYVKCPLSLRNVEGLLAERGIDISHETVRFWWNRFGLMFAAEIRQERVAHMHGYPHGRWHLDEVFVERQRKALLSLARATPIARLEVSVLRHVLTTCGYSDKAVSAAWPLPDQL